MYLCITNRALSSGDFMNKIMELADRPEIEKIILREKDLTPDEYEILAVKCWEICRGHGKPLVINHFVEVAKRLQIPEVQISMESLRTYANSALGNFLSVGVSVHSAEEAVEAQLLGADYLIAGHIFQTDCKKGIPGRGLAFLEEVCKLVSIPVYAIGGISPDNIHEVIRSGAKGGCMMSGFMRGTVL
ncbi:thiamine phosphate synthase [Robinsoniella peoriensis]